MELLECKHLYKEFDDKQILKDINLKIPRGKIIGLLGKNGAGKTTLIKLINDLLTPTSGEILINVEKPGVNSKEAISYLPERTYLNKNMTVNEVINYFNDFYRNLLIISCILIFILNTYSNIIIFMNKRIKMLNSFQMLKKYYE